MDEPNLYTVVARLQRNNEAVDEIYANVGVRSYTVTPDGGFSINGEATPLRGVSRHQDKLYKGNALTVEGPLSGRTDHQGTGCQHHPSGTLSA